LTAARAEKAALLEAIALEKREVEEHHLDRKRPEHRQGLVARRGDGNIRFAGDEVVSQAISHMGIISNGKYPMCVFTLMGG
jgi:hypothetical protein